MRNSKDKIHLKVYGKIRMQTDFNNPNFTNTYLDVHSGKYYDENYIRSKMPKKAMHIFKNFIKN
jgi:hypothetical protein